MPNLDRALTDIAAMRSQLARSTEFRGYGPVTLAATGVLAGIAAGVQAWLLPLPATEVRAYLALWMITAILSVVLIGVETVNRSQRVHSGLANEMIMQAIEQFLPAAIAGILLTLVMLWYAPESLWLLPGIWQVILSLGVFASCRSLPRPMIAVAIWYLASGIVCLAWAKGPDAFSPFAMGLPFAIGQGLAATLLQASGGRHGED